MEKLKRLVIKEELMALTEDYELAIILNQFIYWSERVNDFDKFITEEKQRAENEGIEIDIEPQNGWIYKDMEELKDEILTKSSVSTISRKLNTLVENGWLDRRKSPKYRWDKRYQYRINLMKLARDLYKIGYILQGYRFNIAELLKNPNLHEGKIDDEKETLKNSNLQNENTNLHGAKSNLQNENTNLQQGKFEEKTLKTLENSNLQNEKSNLHSAKSNLQNENSIFQNENTNLQNEKAITIDYYNRLLKKNINNINNINNNNIYSQSVSQYNNNDSNYKDNYGNYKELREDEKKKKNDGLTDGLTDRQNNDEEIINRLYNQLNIDDLKRCYPEHAGLIDEIFINIIEMYLSEQTKINGVNKPQVIVRKAIDNLEEIHLQDLITKFKEKSAYTKITNPKGYIQTMIYNIAFENKVEITNKVAYDVGY